MKMMMPMIVEVAVISEMMMMNWTMKQLASKVVALLFDSLVGMIELSLANILVIVEVAVISEMMMMNWMMK